MAAPPEPSSLTVTQLKDALRQQGIRVPSGSVKADLIKLYRESNQSTSSQSTSPSRSSKSSAKVAPLSQSSPPAHSTSSPSASSPSSSGGFRVLSVQPLRPQQQAPPPAPLDTSPPPSPPPPPKSSSSSRRRTASPRRSPKRRSAASRSIPDVDLSLISPIPQRRPSPEQSPRYDEQQVHVDASIRHEPAAAAEGIPPHRPHSLQALPASAAREPADYSPLRFIVIVLLEVLVTIAVLHFTYTSLNALLAPYNFCNTNEPPTPGCIPCPSHGSCSNGQLVCDEGFVQQGVECVENEEYTKQAYRMGGVLRNHLQQLDGEAICSQREVPVKLADDEAKAVIEQRTGRPVLALVWERLVKRAASSDLVVENSLWSTTAPPLLPFSCQFSLFVREHFLFIALFFGFCVLLLWVYVWLMRERRNSELVQETLIEALTQLYENPNTPFAVSHIRDQVARAGTPQARLWRRVEEAVENDSRVLKAQRVMNNGMQSATWQWDAGPLSPRRSVG